MNIENTVKERYSQGARERQEALCCPVDYDTGLLALLPEEIIARDYGCGDPSRYVREGDVVLDLGSGGGKICYMAAQLVGPRGQVIGVDMNDDMLALARRYQSDMAAKLGGDRVRFLKGYIQDLALDVDALDHYLRQHPVGDRKAYAELKAWEASQRRQRPLIADASVDLVISNCVLNLVSDDEKEQLVQEIFRVLRPGGRVAVSDIVSDRPVPAGLKQDAELWSGCISGAFQESEFLRTFADNGFHAVSYDKWEAQPWRVVEGIEFRSVTLTACKGTGAASGAEDRFLIYRGPFAAVIDDAGQRHMRGERSRVTAERHNELTDAAYRGAFIDPQAGLPVAAAACCAPAVQIIDSATNDARDAGHDSCCC
jgi:ubiquinone/menaquinone biosynthesis C-methylase UbiE